jgi:hypothetical protein
MSSYLPPTENLPIFDSSTFSINNEPLTFNQATNEFLRFPTAQGQETLQNIIVNGQSTFNAPVEVIDNLFKVSNLGVPLLQVSTAFGIACGTTNITTTGTTSTTNLTVNSITTTVTSTIVAGVLNIALGSYAIGRSQLVTMDQNIITVVPSAGVIGGVFKLWLTVDAAPRTFFKACGVINNLAGDTVMGANSIWLIEIFKRSTVDWRMRLTNFT